MTIPTCFADDENTARLAEFFEDIYEYLVEQDVPTDRLPSPWHVLSHVVGCLDEERMRHWLEAYVGLEGVVPSTRDRGRRDSPSAAPKVPRPAYLKAILPSTPEDDSPEEGE